MTETMPGNSKNGVTIKVATRDKTGYDRLRKGGNVRGNVCIALHRFCFTK